MSGSTKKGLIEGESIDEFIYRKNLRQREMLARISPRCLRFSTRKTAWKVLFLALFSSVCTYYGVFQVVLPYLLVTLKNNYLVSVVTIVVTVVLYVFLLSLSIHYRVFDMVNLMVLYGSLFVISVTGIAMSLSNLIPIQGFEILKLFLVLVLINTVMILVSFYVTRAVVCRVNEKLEVDSKPHE